MKEFIKNILILLSTPFYLIGIMIMVIIIISENIGKNLMYLIESWIEYMKSDYKKLYETIKRKK